MEHEPLHIKLSVPKYIVFIVGVFTMLVIVFTAGVFVGFEKAQFSHRLGERYYRDFTGPRPSMLMDRGYMNARGSTGSIVSIDGATLVITTREHIDKTIITNAQTIVDRNRKIVPVLDLKVDDMIAVIGSPNDQGAIDAHIIRILPQ